MDSCSSCGLDVYDGGQLCPICLADPPPGFSPNGTNSPVESSTPKTPTPLQQAALDAISKYDGVVAAARALGCNHGVISLAKAGHDFPKARRVLGLPPRTVPVPPCAECGKVHTRHKQCDDERESRTRHRVSLEVDTAEDAAALRRIFDAHGTRRRVARALVEGRIRLVEAQ